MTSWNENVQNKAIHILESYINETTCNYEPITSEIDEQKKKIDGNSYNYCDVCERVIIGDNVYRIHLNSYRHKKVFKKKKRTEEKQKSESTGKL